MLANFFDHRLLRSVAQAIRLSQTEMSDLLEYISIQNNQNSTHGVHKSFVYPMFSVTFVFFQHHKQLMTKFLFRFLGQNKRKLLRYTIPLMAFKYVFNVNVIYVHSSSNIVLKFVPRKFSLYIVKI